jgi:DNA-binding NarL/FixJ family response regulator
MTSCTLRVVIADEEALFRAGLSRLLTEDPRVDVVGETGDGLEAVTLARALLPDVILINRKMPTLDGLTATRQIVADATGTKVVMLSTFDPSADVAEALRAGASGYVLKNSDPEALISALVAVRLGERVIPGALARDALEIDLRAGPHRPIDKLTRREMEVLRMIANGATNKQIARQLGIVNKTVRNHLSHIYEKLELVDRSHAVLWAVRTGIAD